MWKHCSNYPDLVYHLYFAFTLEEEADLTKCAVNIVVSIPEASRTTTIHVYIFGLDTSWCVFI